MKRVLADLGVRCVYLCCAVIFANPVFGAGWERMNVVDLPNPNGQKFYTTFMDRSTLQKVGGLRRIWIMTNYVKEQAYRGTKDGRTAYIDFRSVKSIDYFDCQKKRMAVAQEDFYSGEMGTGEFLPSGVVAKTIADLHWDSFNVNGFLTSRVQVVCALDTGADAR